jgi:hypothetical protein
LTSSRQSALDAFSLSELGRMVRTRLDADIERLVPTRDQNLEQVAYNLVRAYAVRADGFVALAKAALADFADSL